jgi:hypothetical protein
VVPNLSQLAATALFTCPHCERHGISFFHKVTVSVRYRAVCRYCGNPSGLPRHLNFFVVIAFFLFFATTPYLVSEARRDILAVMLVLAFIAIVLALPLSKRP